MRGTASNLLRLALPVAFARLGVMGMGIADTIMVGQITPEELPYQALGWAPTAVFLVGGIGLLTGVQVLAARAVGAQQPAHAGATLRRGVLLGFVAGAFSAALLALFCAPLLSLFGVMPSLIEPASEVCRVLSLSLPLHLSFVAASLFLEAINRPAAGAVVMWVGNGINLGLNAWLIPELGAVGSAWATVGSRAFLCVAIFGWLAWRYRDSVFALTARPGPDAPSFRALLVVGGAAAVSQIAEAGAFGGMTIIAGRISAQAVAAYQISLNILAVVFMIALGFAAATQVLVSEAIGARRSKAAAEAGWTGLALNSAAMIAAALLFLIGGAALARAFSADPAQVAAVATLMPLLALILTPDGGQVVASGALRGRGDNWFPTASHVLAYVLVMPPLAFFLAEQQGRGVAGLFEAIAAASFLSIAVLAARLLWLTRRPII